MALKLKGSTSGFVAIDAPSVAGNNTLILPENTGSAHQILANDITAGVTTFTQITVSRNGDLTVPGTISIGGTLTYEDVTSVDSVGIVTARGLSIFGNTTGLQVASGISTFQAITATTGTFSGAISGTTATLTGNADVEGGLIVGNGVASPLSGFSAHFHSTGSSNRIQITTSNTGVTNADGAIIMVDSGSNMEILNRENTNIEFFTNNTQRLFIDNSGRLIIGTNSSRTVWGNHNNLQIEGTGAGTNGVSITRNTNDAFYPYLAFGKSRGTSNGSSTIVQDDDVTGIISFNAADGTDMNNQTAYIESAVDGTPGGNDTPGRLAFYTTPDGSGASTERMRIASNGYIGINNNSAGTRLHVTQDWVASYGSISVEASANALVGMGLRSNGSYEAALIWRDGSSGDYLELATQNSNPILFKTSNTERVRIDSSGRVMIGNTNAATMYQDGGDDLVVGNTSGSHGITIISQNNNVGRIMFSDTYTSGTGTYEGQILYSHAQNTLNFYANYTAHTALPMSLGGANGDLTLHTGNLVIGTSGKGIDFSATGGGSNTSGESELFHDYESGSCTILIHDAAGSNISVTNHGTKYTKIGNRVFIEGKFVFAETGSKNGGLMVLYQLPFTPAQSIQAQGVYWYDGTSDAADVTGVVYINSSGNGYLKQATTIGQPSNNKYLTFNEIQKNSSRPLHFSFSYTVS